MFIDTHDEATAIGDVADYFDGQRAAWGFLPNYAHCFAPRPDVAAAWATLNVTIRGGMDRRRYEIATIAAARELRSTYCTAAHSTFLRDQCGDATAMRALAEDPSGAGLDAVDRAVVAFATKVARDAAGVERADIDELRSMGFTDREVADLVYAVAARAFFTTVLDGLGASLDAQTAATFDPELLERLVVGRAPAEGTC